MYKTPRSSENLEGAPARLCPVTTLVPDSLSGERHVRAHLGWTAVKSFEELFNEVQARATSRPAGSGTVRLLDAGVHAIGKKVVEEAAEAWMAAEHEDQARTAEEIAQLIYHVQVLMVARGLTLDDLYRKL